MFRSTLVMVLVMCASLQGQTLKPKQLEGNRRLASASQDLAANIRDAKLLLVGINNRLLQKKLEDLLSKAEGNVAVIQADLLMSAGATANLVNRKAFNDLLAAVKKQSFSKKKAEYLVNYSKLNGPTSRRLSSEQVKQLVAEVQFDKDRVSAAVALFKVTADKENFLTVLDALNFENSRQQIKKKLGLDKSNK